MKASPYSQKLRAQKYRIKRLPTIVNLTVNSVLKRRAEQMINVFETGIAQRKFNLEPLKTITVKRKKSIGYRKPKTELYGKGLEDPRSLLHCLKAYKMKDKYIVKPIKKKHWSGKITLDYLLNIHEYGCTIKKKNTSIRIPPRQAFHKAYAATIRKMRQYEEDKNLVRKACNLYIRTGNEDGFKRIQGMKKL